MLLALVRQELRCCERDSRSDDTFNAVKKDVGAVLTSVVIALLIPLQKLAAKLCFKYWQRNGIIQIASL